MLYESVKTLCQLRLGIAHERSITASSRVTYRPHMPARLSLLSELLAYVGDVNLLVEKANSRNETPGEQFPREVFSQSVMAVS